MGEREMHVRMWQSTTSDVTFLIVACKPCGYVSYLSLIEGDIISRDVGLYSTNFHIHLRAIESYLSILGGYTLTFRNDDDCTFNDDNCHGSKEMRALFVEALERFA